MSAKPKVLVTGASSGIGAVYADRFARRGHNVVLVARDAAKLEALAARLRRETDSQIEVLRADLTDRADTARVEARLRDDAEIEILINNAGVATLGGVLSHDADTASQMIELNVTALTRLSMAVAPRFAAAGRGAIVNVGSVVGLAPEFNMAVYGATKAYVLHLSQAMQGDLGSKGVYVQAVLPATTRTEIWAKGGVDVDTLPNAMDVGELVDAALVGFDRKERVTIPPLPDDGQFAAYETARTAMLPNYRNKHAAARYRG